MKKLLTVRSVLVNSFIVLTFAACGINANQRAEICSHEDSEIYVAENKFAQQKVEGDSHPMILPNNNNSEEKSHPMLIYPCIKPE